MKWLRPILAIVIGVSLPILSQAQSLLRSQLANDWHTGLEGKSFSTYDTLILYADPAMIPRNKDIMTLPLKKRKFNIIVMELYNRKGIVDPTIIGYFRWHYRQRKGKDLLIIKWRKHKLVYCIYATKDAITISKIVLVKELFIAH